MGWRRVRPGQTALGGTGQQQAKAKSLFHVRRVTGSQADGQARRQQCWSDRKEECSIQGGGEGYKRREGKGSVQDAGGGIE